MKQQKNFLGIKFRNAKFQGFQTIWEPYMPQSAVVQIQKGNYDKALSYFNQAFSFEKRAGNYINCKIILNDIGYNIYFKHFQNFEKALNYYKQALIFKDQRKFLIRPDAFETLNLFDNIAIIYVQKGKFDSAFYFFQSAFDQINNGLTEENLLSSTSGIIDNPESKYYILDLLINKGDAFLKRYNTAKQMTDLEEAIRIYKTTDRFLDKVKQQQSDLKSKLFWRSDSRRLYEHAIQAGYLSHNFNVAFYFFEKGRAVLLNDQLNEQQWIKESDVMKQTQVKKRIISLGRKLAHKDSTSAPYAKTQMELFTQKEELYHLEEMIKTLNPLYYQSFLDTTFITLLNVHDKLLNDHQALLEIFTGDSAVYSLLISFGHTYLNMIDKKDFDSTTARFISYISNSSLMNSKFPDYAKTAHHLYELIFQNMVLPNGRIIISPDGQYFPFEALVTDNTNPSSPVYFLKDHAASYTYSSRYLLNDFNKNVSLNFGNFLGIAPVNYSPKYSLAALNGSNQSLNEIGYNFSDVHILTGADASKRNFQEQFTNYKIIQLYTHASESSNQGEPVIYFADSALYLSELIPESKPQTRLIVLSACETGNGKLNQGEGVFSFNRGFASLGIPSSITNLWSVDNKSTYQITELFYKYLADGLPIDVALQKAKLDFIQKGSKQNRLPYYWAAAVLAGKSDAIKGNKTFPWKDIAIVSGLLVLSFFVWQKQGKNKN